METLAESPKSCAVTTDANRHRGDPLSDALSLMRVSGSLLFTEDVVSPWGVLVPEHRTLERLLDAPGDCRAIAFHFVHRGDLSFRDSQTELELGRGDMVICVGGTEHSLSGGRIASPVPLEAYLRGGQNPFRPRDDVSAEVTSLVCGAFLLERTQLNPLFASLPSVMTLHSAGRGVAAYSAVAEMLALEIESPRRGSKFAVERLLELLFVAAIRSFADLGIGQRTGWLLGIGDSTLEPALTQFHAQPGDDWRIDRLARVAHLSPSRFAARFSATFGQGCMTYVGRWRMSLAMSLLQDTRLSAEEIAWRVGYTNPPAFGRAFKRYVGTTPAAWRKSSR
jgi:AraC-like DNA-binding protein